MAKGRFQNLTVDAQSLRRMSVSDRLDFLRSSDGLSILPNFTPTQLNDLFPSYYRRSFTDIGQAFKAVSDRRNLSSGVDAAAAEPRPTSGLYPRSARDAAAAGSNQIPAWQRSVRDRYGVDLGADDSSDASALIKRKEGYRSRPYWDVNAWRIGYGSDTITRADGSVVKVTPGMEITKEDAERDLRRRIPEFQNQGIIQHIGQNAWDKLNAQTKAALTSLAYNYGSISRLESLKKAIAANDKNMIAQAIESYADHNRGVNFTRRMEEARMVRNSSDTTPSTTTVPDLPQGLNSNLVEEYNKMTPFQKRNFHRALNKMGENDVSAGVNEMNKIYQQNPNSIDRVVATSGNFIQPVDAEIGSQFGPRKRPTAGASTYHRGVDYRTAAGTNVRAANDGVVTRAGESRGYGYMVEIDHGNGIRTRYAHLRSFDVKPGDRVSRGQNFARTGGVPGEPGAGTTTGPHLHYEVIRNGERINPVEFYRENTTYSEPASSPSSPTQVPNLQTPGASTGERRQVQEQRQRPAQPSAPTAPTLSIPGTPSERKDAIEEPTPALALGGDVQTDAKQLNAYAINKSRQRRDDMVVTDGAKPLFTMNSEEEMKFNPDSGKVSVNPSARGLKADPEALQEKLQPQVDVMRQTMDTNVERETKEVAPQQVVVMPSPSAPVVNSYDVIRDKTLETMTPSFERAIARSRFVNTGDAALGGHFDWGASNMA
jgi:GH24 family phage-related lysozyme (muramidase)